MRSILVYFSVKYNGNWKDIYQAITSKEQIDFNEKNIVYQKYKDQVLTIIDSEYPEKLKNVYCPPFVLFYKGDISLLKETIVSIVGSRDATSYGVYATKKIVKDLTKFQIVTCSGLAKGIDSTVHDESLKNQIRTIAVLPCGIDKCYPKENFSLYQRIEKEGLIISEYPNQVTPFKDQIPFRNRIVASLADHLIVTEAHFHSGTMITVRYALEMGKDIYAVPYPINEDSFCNKLISDGAYLICDGKDIFRKN